MMLRYNGLERVSSDWLAGLDTSLMELFIVEPELRSIPDDSLLHLKHLEAVTIQTNLMKRLPLFINLPMLRYLQLESLSLLDLSPRNFKNVPSLEKLHIASSPRLTRLEANLLRDLPNLLLVNISYCGISWMHPRAITGLPSLKELALIGNKITDAGLVGRASRELPALEIIRLDHNYIDKLNEAAFVDLPALKKLFLSNNRITELHHGAFHSVPQLRSLDLNRNMLRRVHPESFLQHSGSGLEELWLIENDISHVAELRSLLDALPRLTFLDMSYNNLEAIPFGALRGHATLEHLHLDYNKIHLIDREAFMAMPALRELRLRNNSLTDILEGPMWNLPALKGLDLAGNYFRRLEPRHLGNLPSLRKLDLSGNELNYINPETFLVTPALEHINMSHNLLNALHPATFRHLLNLYELDVSFNNLLEFVPGLPRGIEYLHMSNNAITGVPISPSPDLDLPALRMLDLSSNQIQRLPKSSLRTLPQLRRLYIARNLLQQLDEQSLSGLNRLEVLDLEENRIYQIHQNCLKEMSELRSLNLRNNRLDILIPDLFKNSPRLKQLNLSKNQIAEILPNTLDSNRELQTFDISDNVLVQLPSTMYSLKNLRYLYLTSNRIKTVDPQILNGLSQLRELRLSKNYMQELKQGIFNNLQYLKVLHLDNNELESIEPDAILNLPILKSIKLSQNKLKEIPNSAFHNLPSLQMIELQENSLQNIAPGAFNMVPHLLMLNLSNNELGNIERAGLRSLRSLEMLDLSRNRISKVSSKTLEKMEWLVELRMDDNIICGVQGSPFNSMPRLRVLSMKNNKMMSFPEQAVYKLRGNIAVIDIDGNPLSCACNMLWMQAWLQEVAMQGPRCNDGTLVRDMRLSRQDCTAEEQNADLVAPGCEAELLSAPGLYGTSQVFSQWMKLKSNATKEALVGKHGHFPPSPEESDYFYDDYVDYPFNETVNNMLNSKNTAVVPVPLITTTNRSPHYTPGDTPTMYAASGNKTKLDIPKEVVNSPSTSGFTFFGVPLPSINLNKLLGGRKEDKKSTLPQAERKTAIVNNIPPVRTTGRRNMHPPTIPEVQTGGFTPILPGSGGFKPIIPPQFVQPLNETTKKPEEFFTTTTIVPNLIRKETFETTSVPPEVFVSKPIDLQGPTHIRTKLELVDAEKEIETIATEMTKTELTTTTPKTTTVPTMETTSVQKVEESLIITTDAVLPVIESTQPPQISENLQISTAEANTLVENWSSLNNNNDPMDDLKKQATGTPLSALLIPGGQQPQFRQGGRSTITKVQSPHLAADEPIITNIENAHISEPLTNNIRNSMIITSTSEEPKKQTNDDTNWYFANYNKTNIGPYIGKTPNGQMNHRALNLIVLLNIAVIVKLLV